MGGGQRLVSAAVPELSDGVVKFNLIAPPPPPEGARSGSWLPKAIKFLTYPSGKAFGALAVWKMSEENILDQRDLKIVQKNAHKKTGQYMPDYVGTIVGAGSLMT